MWFESQLQKGASDARGDDIFHLRRAVGDWLNKLHPKPQPLFDPDDRSSRGIQHDTTGFLLCPIEFDWVDEE